LNKSKRQKENVVLPFPVQQSQKATPSSTMPFPITVPFPSTAALGGLEGVFLC